MVDFLSFLKGKRKSKSTDLAVDQLSPYLYEGQTSYGQWQNTVFDGSKFSGGFGITQLQTVDYWTLRARSSQLFNQNLYARGLIRRLVTNEINTGLTPECSPDEELIGLAPDSLNDWTETVENRFSIWARNPELCDWGKSLGFGAIQGYARREAMIGGDALVIVRQSKRTGLPVIQIVRGDKVRTPLSSNNIKLRKGHKILHGVELDAAGRVAAHWVRQDNGDTKRIPAVGEKSGRKISWLIFGCDKRVDDVRGQPLLSILLQSLNEIDKYRDSTTRKAVNNSIVAMFIKKTLDKPGTLPITGGAVSTKSVVGESSTGRRSYNIANHEPGFVIEELQAGEEPVLKGGEGVDINFGAFEEAIVQAIAWSQEVPPEILRLAFSNNYSASQAAINEFKIYLNKVWFEFGESFCQPIYKEWLISETLMQKISAPSFLESWRNPKLYDVFGAWVSCDWYGSIKPSTDMLKSAKGAKMLVDEGWSTNAKQSRMLDGTKFSKNIKRLKRENELKVEAARPLAEFKKEYGEGASEAFEALAGEELEVMLDDFLGDRGIQNAGQ